MRQSRGWQQVAPSARNLGRSKTYQFTYEQQFPHNGEFEFDDVTTQIAPDGSVRTVHKRVSYPLECGCPVRSDKGIAGPCIKGLLVCPSHAKNCPINSIDPNFDWVNAPRIRPCLRGCKWKIRWMRFIHWLVTPPAGSK